MTYMCGQLATMTYMCGQLATMTYMCGIVAAALDEDIGSMTPLFDGTRCVHQMGWPDVDLTVSYALKNNAFNE